MDLTIRTPPTKKVRRRVTIPKRMVILERNALYLNITVERGVRWVAGVGKIQHGKEYSGRMRTLDEQVAED